MSMREYIRQTGKGESPNRAAGSAMQSNKERASITTSLCLSLPETAWEGLERLGNSSSPLEAFPLPSVHCMMSTLTDDHESSQRLFHIMTPCPSSTIQLCIYTCTTNKQQLISYTDMCIYVHIHVNLLTVLSQHQVSFQYTLNVPVSFFAFPTK